MTEAYPLPDAALDQHEAIVGKTGSGKTHTAKTQVEHLLDLGRRVCIIDPTGAWWGLRSSADGKKPGYPVVVFGGEHADIPITEHSGAALAEAIASGHLTCIIDLSGFLMGERRRFVTAFAQTLHRRNKTPLHLVIDEADEFAPQRPLPETRRMMHEIDRLVRRGRIKGFRIMFITQRPAVLHKDILTQANTLIAMRLTGPQDRRAIEEWIRGQADPEQGKEVIASLPKLRLGEGWIWSPEYDVLKRVRFPAIKTFDSSKAPEDDADHDATVELAHVDLDELKGRLADIADSAAQNDPDALRGRIAELERELAKEAPDAAVLDEAFRKGILAGQRELEVKHEAILDKIRVMAAQICRIVGSDVSYAFDNDGNAIEPEEVKLDTPARPKPRPVISRPTGMTTAAERMLRLLAQHAPARFTWGQIATLAGLKPRGGHFNASRKALRDRNLIVEDGNLLWASEAGMNEAGAVPPAPATVEERIGVWREALSPLSAQILDLLVAIYPRWIERTRVAADLGKQPRGGHWNSGMAMLRNNHLIEERGTEIRADTDLFTVPKAIQEARER